MSRSRRWALPLCVLIGACAQTPVQTPTRSLDRPSDAATVCAQFDKQGNVTTLPRACCSTRSQDRAACPLAMGDTTLRRLYLLVPNSGRGDVALVEASELNPVGADGGVAATDAGASIIDLDRRSPGYSFLPVGTLPESLRASDDGSYAVSADVGDCGLSVIDVKGALAIPACDQSSSPNMGACTAVKAQLLSNSVRGVVPTSGGVPLAARPAWLELVDGKSATCTSGQCALVAFPSCQLVAEVDLGDGRLTQALRLDGNGAATVVNADSVRCRAECFATGDGGMRAPLDMAQPADMAQPVDASAPPDQAMPMPGPDDGGADDASMVDAGMTSDGSANMPPEPSLPPLFPNAPPYPVSFAVDDTAGARKLFIADAVSPRLTLLTLGDDGSFGTVSALALAGDAGGVARVRLSPPITALADGPGDPGPRYLYAIARDRTVRVLDAEQELECETNPDPVELDAYLQRVSPGFDLVKSLSAQPDGWPTTPPSFSVERLLRCLPVGAPDTPHRAALATSPGIALPNGALPRDVSFVYIDQPQPNDTTNKVAAPSAAPAVLYGWFTWVVSSSGDALPVNLADLCPQPNIPADIAQPFACQPSQLTNSVNTVTSINKDAGTQSYIGAPRPRAIDVMPNRLRNGTARFVVPDNATDTKGGTRLGDVPLYTIGGAASSDTTGIPQLCSVPSGGGGCNTITGVAGASPNAFSLRTLPPASGDTFRLAWEGQIPGSALSSGSLDTTNDALSDPVAGFCSLGARPGDKLYLTGCATDADCGPSQVCFIDSAVPVNLGTGLCVQRDPNHLSKPDPSVVGKVGDLCRPWSQAFLRYRVVEAGQDRLKLDELPLPEHPAETHACETDADCADVKVYGLLNLITTPLATSCLDVGDGRKQCLRACNPTPDKTKDAMTQFQESACSAGYLCATSHYGGNRCLRAPLPSTNPDKARQCFEQLQKYEVHVGESFLGSDDTVGFLHNDYPDPATGQCVAPGDSSPQRLLDGRVPLSAPACGAAIQSDWLTSSVSGEPTVCSLRFQPGSACSANGACGGTDACINGECVKSAVLHIDNPYLTYVVQVPIDRTVSTLQGSNIAVRRVPDENSVLSFVLYGGDGALAFPLAVDVHAQLPRSAVTAPDLQSVYVIDEGTQSTSTGLRGQVLRVLSAPIPGTDRSFIIR